METSRRHTLPDIRSEMRPPDEVPERQHDSGDPNGCVTGKENSSDPVYGFVKSNYVLFTTVGQGRAPPVPENFVLDTGRELDLFHKKKNHSAWLAYICPVQSPKLVDACRRITKLCGLIHFAVRVEEFRARVSSISVQNLAVDCLPRTSFIDYLVETILPELRKVGLDRSSSIANTFRRSLNNPERISPLHLETSAENYGQR